MSERLEHADGGIRLEELPDGRRRIEVEDLGPDRYVPHRSWVTGYDRDLIAKLLAIKGPAWLCDEIMRDEDPAYVENDIRHDIFSYTDPADWAGCDVLDFGCGCGASTMILGRLAPGCRLVGVELVPEFLEAGRLRAAHYGLANVQMLESPSPEELPAGIGPFDHIVFSAVFEHLLPHERLELLPRIWGCLKPGGVLYLNQTPHRYFPIEGHTTGLPLINYLPDGWTAAAARRFSGRVARDANWESMLRNGIRGGTQGEVMRILAGAGGEPELLRPGRDGITSQLDLWYRSASIRHGGAGLKLRRTALGLVRALTGHTVVPNLSLAIRKRAEP